MEHVAIVSHDAGGAEILSSWLNRSYCQASVVAAGPAEEIFRRKCLNVELQTLDEALAMCTWVLCGTGWQSNFERQAIAQGRAMGKRTVAFLDHWVNYLERFKEGGESLMPNEIWVGDIDAERIARALFKETPVLLVPNPYTDDILAAIHRACVDHHKLSANKVLYVCEPIADHALAQYGNERHLGYTEYDALRFFLTHLSALGKTVESITIRPHPSEREDKYHWAVGLTSLPVEFGGNNSLLQETLNSDIVVGCESMAMVVGLLAGKRVISTIPPGGRPCQLPHREISYMQELLRDSIRHA
jgi:hypothetical protein